VKIDIEKILKDLEKHLDDSSNSTQVIENKNKWFKANITPLNMQIKNIPNDEKADYGKQLKILNDSVNKTFEKKLNEISEIEEQKNHVVNYDININTADLRKGALNPITIIYHALIEYFEKMNFDISFGEEITTTKYGFDSLNVPITHPTRQTSETFYLNDTNTIIMRQQNTEGTARALANAAIKYKKHPEEVRVVTCGKTYRNDDDDAVHSHQFHQLDFV
jgi:phenylalanyl-tRNA synthetase alpha chain